MGLKFAGSEGSSSAELFGISLTAATFQVDGILPSMRTLLKRSRRAVWREGTSSGWCMIYGERGGADVCLDLLITWESSSVDIGDMSMTFLGQQEGAGIQGGV